MVRRALIIYCDNTKSGRLPGTIIDNDNFISYLTSSIGGNWFSNEILSLRNPDIETVKSTIESHFNKTDYTFTIFTGHGFINTNHNNLQYLELNDGNISVLDLRSSASKQTLLIDACRGKFAATVIEIKESLKLYTETEAKDKTSTRKIFDDWVNNCEEGLITLYSASENQSSLDTNNGGAYLLSLVRTVENIFKSNKKGEVITLKVAHDEAAKYLLANFETTQNPSIQAAKRLKYFPFAVRHTII